MLKKFLFTVWIFIFFGNFSVQAKPLSLSECIELALENDESIESAEYNRESAKWNLPAMRRQDGPTLRWNSEAYKIGGRDYRSAREAHKKYGNKGSYVFDDEGNYLGFASGSTAYDSTFNNSLGISMPFYTGGQLEGNIKNRRYGLNTADLTLENTRQTVKYQVIAAYYNVLRQQNIVEVNESAVKMASEQLNLLQIQYEEGSVAYADVLQMQVQLANYNQSLTSARSGLSVAKSTLLSIIELPEETEIELTDEFLYKQYEFTLEECQKYALENRSDLAAAIYNVNQAESAVSAAKSGNRPTSNRKCKQSNHSKRSISKRTQRTLASRCSIKLECF